MTDTAPDPEAIREANVAEVARLNLPPIPPNFPLVWEPGDQVDLRPLPEIEGRVAILNVVLARCFGMPPHVAVQWLLDAHLIDQLSRPEWHFVAADEGDRLVFVLHLDAVFALAWVLGLAMDLDPLQPSADGLVERLPQLHAGESFAQWRSRTLTAPREPGEVAALLDLYYCLDWAYLEAERLGLPLPGVIDSNAIGQRRWALEWVVMLTGPHHEPPPNWEDVDLST